MSAKQVSSGYILWKSARSRSGIATVESARLLTAVPAPEWSNLIQAEFYQAGNTPSSAVWGEQTLSVSTRSKEILRDSVVGGKLFQPVPVPKKRLENSVEKAGLFQLVSIQRKFPGIVWKRSGCPGSACSEEIAGTGQTGGISSEASAWGKQPADARTEKHPEGHRAFRVFCYVREITSSGRFQTTAESPSGGAAGAGACPTGTAHGFRP